MHKIRRNWYCLKLFENNEIDSSPQKESAESNVIYKKIMILVLQLKKKVQDQKKYDTPL